MQDYPQKKRKIAFLAHGNRNLGGGEKYLFSLVSKLDRELFSPIVLYSKHNSIISDLEQRNIQVLHFPMGDAITSVYRDELAFGNLLRSLIRLWYFLLAISNLYFFIKKQGIDVIHAHDNLSKLISVPAARLARIRVVTVCHDQLGSSRVDRALLWVQRSFMDRVFCVSNYVEQLFVRRGVLPGNTKVIPNGIDLEFWKIPDVTFLEVKGEGRNVVFGIIAMFDRVKGHDVLFQALRIVVNKGIENFSCLVIGDGREKVHILECAESCGVTKFLDFRGYLSDARSAMRELDFLVVPSTQESFGMVALEAMATGVPVIASHVGGLPELIVNEETGFLVPAGDAQILAEKIIKMMNHSDLRRTMGRKCVERAIRYFDVNKNVQSYEMEILEIIK